MLKSRKIGAFRPFDTSEPIPKGSIVELMTSGWEDTPTFRAELLDPVGSERLSARVLDGLPDHALRRGLLPGQAIPLTEQEILAAWEPDD